MTWTPQLKGEAFELILSASISKFKDVSCINNLKVYSNTLDRIMEIDILVVTPWCIYSVEAKSFSSYLRGSLRDLYWVGISGSRTTEIFNPVIQNIEHIRALKQNLVSEGIYLPHINNYVVAQDTCDLSGVDSPPNLVMKKADFIDRIITDSLYRSHTLDTKLIINKVFKVANRLSELHIGR